MGGALDVHFSRIRKRVCDKTASTHMDAFLLLFKSTPHHGASVVAKLFAGNDELYFKELAVSSSPETAH